MNEILTQLEAANHLAEAFRLLGFDDDDTGVAFERAFDIISDACADVEELVEQEAAIRARHA